MSPINLRVPPNMSKNLYEIKKKSFTKTRNDSGRYSVSLRIPNKSIMSLSELGSLIGTESVTPISSAR
ncbi:hypothetical protein SteCoe_26321 [Stentor coeruleus]|uniref:Uncharacterized protein n=1 Tax=Stentor coeruleus TaxID=5963 RepID=A0A1R2BD88_9CILI|nr:hypothetical protein SteCoe_26321 [Stentor coeruleus]